MLTGFDGTGSATAGESAQDFMAITAGHPWHAWWLADTPLQPTTSRGGRRVCSSGRSRPSIPEQLFCNERFMHVVHIGSGARSAGSVRKKTVPHAPVRIGEKTPPFERLLLPWCQRSKPACHQRCTLQPLMRPRSVGADRRAHVVSRGHGKGLEWAQS
jgi:hypothetical protein